jgi:hypothetical protein
MTEEPLQQLANAYGVAATVDAVADAIIARTPITAGVNERLPVIEVVTLLVRDPDTLTLMKDHSPLPHHLTIEMTRAVAHHEPAIPPGDLVDIALTNVRYALDQAG